MNKLKKLRKTIIAYVISAILLTEPFADFSVVYAEESAAEAYVGEEEAASVDLGTEETDSVQNQSEGAEAEEDSSESQDSGSEEPGTDQQDSGSEEGTQETESEEENNESTSEDVGWEEQVTEEEETEETPEEAEAEEKEDLEDDLNGFSAMPSDYQLTAAQIALKEELSETLSEVRESEEGDTYAEGQIITFADSSEEAEMIAEAYQAEVISFDMGVLTLELSEDVSVKSAITVASSMDNNLPAVWPNYFRTLYEEETETESDNTLEEYEQALMELDGYEDPYLLPDSDYYQWFHTTVGSPYAWEAGYTGDSIKVGVIDSGIDENDDLASNIFAATNFCDEESDDTSDVLGHGTHVAGIIAALANGSQGVGVAPDAQIYNAKVFEGSSASDSTIIAAINYLIGEEDNTTSDNVSTTEPRVDIINMSLGGIGYSSAWQFVLDKAYQKGVIVFAAAGNDGGSVMMYPAAYDHVIAVAATDTNNQRAYFSNYGSTVDLSAPGVNIYSTLGSSYSSLQGTSMACPVAAGEAAVILSAQEDLSALQNKSGADRVDALESVMKSNVISAGSGMGKGITSLTKVFNLTTASAKPNAPTITITLAEDQQSAAVTIKAQANMQLCYTTNGKTPVYKNEETDANTTLVEGNEVTFTLDCSQAAKGTVKAFAMNESGVASAVKSQAYSLSPYVTAITVSGSTKVEQGKSITLSAAVTPAYASNKKVTWELQTSDGAAVDTAKISITQNGRITATAQADIGDYQVIVTAQDDGQASAKYSIQVVASGAAVQSLAFDRNVVKELWLTQEDENPTLELAEGLIAKIKNEEGSLEQIGSGSLSDYITWSSNKTAVATVDEDGTVTAYAAGTATITAKAKDNGNKKATIKITVKQGVTGITITTDKGKTDETLFTVAAGKSMTLKAVLNPTKPTNKKVLWSIESDDPKVTINASSGKLTVKAGAAAGTYTVTAAAADGKGAVATQDVTIYDGAIGEIKLDTTKTTLYTQYVDTYRTNTQTITATIKGAGGSSSFNPNAYTVTSSREAVVTIGETTIELNTDGSYTVQIPLTTTGDQYGKANIVIASTDGSNKKATCVVTVTGGITKVEIRDSAKTSKVSKLTLFRSGTGIATAASEVTLYAVITASDGANTSAYTVASSNSALVSPTVNQETGEITLTASSKSTGKATITLTATDGSNKKASCTVTVVNPVSRINIAPKNGASRYVAPGKSVQLVATLETECGPISNKNVTWSVSDAAKSLGISVSSSGKVSLSKQASLSGTTAVSVTATARDGSGVSRSYSVYATTATTYLYAGSYYASSGVYIMYFYSDCKSPMTCSSSSPAVISPTISYSSSSGVGTIQFVAAKKGSATITIKAMDSTNKTLSLKFVVK